MSLTCIFDPRPPSPLTDSSCNMLSNLPSTSQCFYENDSAPSSSFWLNDANTSISRYFDFEETNNLLNDTENSDFLILHVNAVSLEKRHGSIKAMLARLEKAPSIFFVSEARLSNDKNVLKTQIPKIELEGYHSPVFCTSPYSADSDSDS